MADDVAVVTVTDWCTKSHDISAVLKAKGYTLRGFTGDRQRPDYIFEDPSGELAWASTSGSLDLSIDDGRKVVRASREIYKLKDESYGPRSTADQAPKNPHRFREGSR